MKTIEDIKRDIEVELECIEDQYDDIESALSFIKDAIYVTKASLEDLGDLGKEVEE